MSKILIIGNVLKDVYLKLDNRQNDFEEDSAGISWLDLAFNGTSHKFFQRTSVYGGAAVSLAVLSRLGLDTKILNSKTEYKNGEISWQEDVVDYRYILCHEGEITYFVPNSRQATNWGTPSGTPEWILVDRSTLVSPNLVTELKNFLKLSPNTKLAVHAEKKMTPAGQRLAEMADVLFIEDEPPVHRAEKIVDKVDLGKPNTQMVCHITPKKIVLGDAEESWELSRTDMLTHLTVYSTIVATVLGVIAVGGSATDAVLWARLNAENTTLESSLSARKLQELATAEVEKRANLKLITRSLMASKRGILAADESENTLTKRLVKFGISATAASRQTYRDMLLTAPELGNYLSGVILTPETANAKTQQGQNYLEYLTGRGLIVGVKADKGQAKFGNTEETYTTGQEDLHKRLKSYYAMGARFAKWHAKFVIGEDMPSFAAVEKNAELLAGFAKECQLVGLVPMIESDVSGDGDHTIEKDIEVTDRVLTTVFEKLAERRVNLESCILKTNMVTSGREAIAPSTAQDVGMATAAIIKHAVPEYVGGVLFLSGGQSAKNAMANLATIAKNGPFAWPISFAFGRALQDSLMQAWQGKTEKYKDAQATLKLRLQDCVEALQA